MGYWLFSDKYYPHWSDAGKITLIDRLVLKIVLMIQLVVMTSLVDELVVNIDRLMVKMILLTGLVVKNTLSNGFSFKIALIDRMVAGYTSSDPLMVKITLLAQLIVQIRLIDGLLVKGEGYPFWLIATKDYL